MESLLGNGDTLFPGSCSYAFLLLLIFKSDPALSFGLSACYLLFYFWLSPDYVPGLASGPL